MASGMSAAVVSRIGLPLSQVSASASRSRFSSIRSAMRLRISGALGDAVRPQASFAACAASSAGLDVGRVGAGDLAELAPVIGEVFSK